VKLRGGKLLEGDREVLELHPFELLTVEKEDRDYYLVSAHRAPLGRRGYLHPGRLRSLDACTAEVIPLDSRSTVFGSVSNGPPTKDYADTPLVGPKGGAAAVVRVGQRLYVYGHFRANYQLLTRPMTCHRGWVAKSQVAPAK
jgi:hypothetical protein